MKYMGSKSKIVKFILPILQGLIDKNNISLYIEPFVGGCNVIDKIKCKKRIGSDINPYLIELLKAHQKGLLNNLPEHISKEEYSEVRNSYNSKDSSKYEMWYIGAIGFLASYNGRFFDGGYAGEITTKEGNKRNYFQEAKRNLLKQDLSDITFYNKDFYKLKKSIKSSLIYCDPPYKDTKQYNYSKNFNYDMFWNWVRDMSKNNIVIVSEEQAPNDFKVIWQQDIKRTIDNNSTVCSVEKLFSINKV